MIHLPTKMPSLPSFRAAVDGAASGENLKAVASATSDPETLLGLAALAKAGDPVRKEIGELAIRTRKDYDPILAVLALIMDRIDDDTVGELVQRDPDNALGHYLQGTLWYISNREEEAVAAFRIAAACGELRLYQSITGEALFKALDLLGLQGLDRLCALSWTASRWTNFSSVGIQPIHRALSELARPADTTARSELAEILITLAGHLFATNFTNRWFARQAVQSAFLLKAELAANRPPTMDGYAAAVQGLTNAMLPGASLDSPMTPNALHLAQELPSKIHRAFAVADPALINSGALGELNFEPPDSDRTTFENAKENATQAAKKLIEVALADPDGILGAYLKGLPKPTQGAQQPPWASFATPVGSLIQERPDLFRAAAANEQAMNVLNQLRQNDPAVKNIGRMMEIAWALQTHAQSHDLTYPDNVTTLFEHGQLKPPLEPRSLLTGRPYVYVAAGEKGPQKSNEQVRFVLLYDDELDEHGCFPCVVAACLGTHIRPQELREQLQRRGKA